MSKITDPIADFLTRVRNGIKANHRIVDVPASNIKKAITQVLFDKGYILNYKFDDAAGPQGTIKIALKYHPTTKLSAIRELKRVSKPGLRQYKSADSAGSRGNAHWRHDVTATQKPIWQLEPHTASV